MKKEMIIIAAAAIIACFVIAITVSSCVKCMNAVKQEETKNEV